MQFLIILIFITYLVEIYQVFAVGTYGVTFLDIATIIFYLYIFKRIFWNGHKLEIKLNPAIYFIMIFTLGVLLSGITPLLSANEILINQYLKTTSHLFFLMLFTLIACIVPLTPKIWTNAIRCWLIISIIINIFAVYQIVARAYDLPLAWLDATNMSFSSRGSLNMEEYQQLSLHYESFFRATSIFPEPSALAVFNLFILIFLVIPYIQNRKPFLKSKLVNSIIFISSLTATFLTFSLSAVMGLMLIFTAVLVFESKKKLVKLIPVFVTSLLLLIVADAMIESYSNISVAKLFQSRIEGITSTKESRFVAGESFLGRAENAKKTIEIWQENPVLGAGSGLIGYYEEKGIAFSDYGVLSSLAEMGILGFIGFVGIFIVLFISSIKLIKKSHNILDANHARLAGILIYILIILFQVNFISGNNLVRASLWIFLGFLISVITYNNVLNFRSINLVIHQIPLSVRFFRNLNIGLISKKADGKNGK